MCVQETEMWDGVESVLIVEPDRAAPQTPPLIEPHQRSLSGVHPYTRHRKTSSGFFDLDMEKLLSFPVEALPPGEAQDLSHHTPDDYRDQSELTVNVEKGLMHHPLSSIERQLTPDNDYYEGMDGGSVTWPDTPSCRYPILMVSHCCLGKSCGINNVDCYDSDRETVVEDDGSSCASESEGEYIKDWDMTITLVDDEALDFSLDTLSPPCDLSSSSSSSLPDFVGLSPDTALVSIPEDTEVYIDKTGNYVVEEDRSERGSMESIDYDPAGWEEETSDESQEGSRCSSVDRIRAIQHQSERDGETTQRPIDHDVAVKAIMDGGMHGYNRSGRHRSTKSTFEESLVPIDDVDVACEVVLSDIDSIVSSPSKKRCKGTMGNDDTKVSAGCCAGFKRISSLSKAKSRLEALGQAIKKHWPVISSAIVPFVLFFSRRRQ